MRHEGGRGMNACSSRLDEASISWATTLEPSMAKILDASPNVSNRQNMKNATRSPRQFVLREVPKSDPIPTRPPGYFAEAYDSGTVRKDNRFSKASVIRAPKELE